MMTARLRFVLVRLTAIFLFVGIMPSDAYPREITTSKRFEAVRNVPVKTKVAFNLYHLLEVNQRRFPEIEYRLTQSTITNVPEKKLVGVIPAGHKVIFERAFSENRAGDTLEILTGFIEFNGKKYAIESSWYVFGDGKGEWPDFYSQFEIPKKK